MTSIWLRRLGLGVLCASQLLLAACGSGSVASAIKPKRFLSVGDGFSDVGQGGYRYTIHDGSNNWLQELASRYSLTVAPASAGGFGYAQGNARVVEADTQSGLNVPSVKAQIDTLLARTTPQADDLVFINGGMSDIVAAVSATGISPATTATVTAAGKALADQVRRLVQAGGTHVVVTGVYNLGLSPWAASTGKAADITTLSLLFNDTLLMNIADLGAQVLYFDAAQFYNLVVNRKSTYPISNFTTKACTTPDATTCTPSTIAAGVDPNLALFADSLYLTPAAQRIFVGEQYLENAYTRLKLRW